MDAIANRNNRRPVWANNHDLLGNQGNHYNHGKSPMPKLVVGVETYVQNTLLAIHAHCKLKLKERIVHHSDGTEKNVYA